MDPASLLIGALAGGAIGAAGIWAALQPRLGTLSLKIEAETKRAGDLQQSLQQREIDLAQMTERAARLPELAQVLTERETDLEAARARMTALEGQTASLGATLTARSGELETAAQQLFELRALVASLQAERADQVGRIGELSTALAAERQQTAEKVTLLQSAKEQMTDQFKALAADILEEKSKRFAEQNQASLGQLLEPLKTKLTEFQGKVEEVYIQEGKDRVALGEQVRQLAALNQQLSQDAHQLTRALKGDAKARGNWGEVILERMLEAAGLRKDHEYATQSGQRHDDGSRSILDVVVYLPEGRHLVIDSKVSLVAYDSYINAETEEGRQAALKQHVDSVRTHLKGLSAKNYENLFKQGSPDFVVMFVPIEPAFLAAIGNDTTLWQAAWDKSVLMVSPSSLLFVLRSVAYLWRQDQQSQNYQEIADRGGKLYDKLCGFVEELTKIGSKLTDARSSYDEALKLLSSGNGNAIRQAEQLKALGVKPKKALPAAVLRGNAVEGSGEDALAGTSADAPVV